jgi:hypothetical protein
MNYPKMKYHKTLEAIVIASADEELKLSSDWADSPAAFGTVTAPSADQLAQMTIEQAKKLADEAAAAIDPQPVSKKSRA